MKKLYCALAVAALAMSANAADYYLIGGFNGWSLKDSKCLFADQGDGSYVLDYAGTLTSGFKINDGTWGNDDANFGGSDKLTVGEVYTLTVGGSSGNITMDGNVANPHIVFNPTAKTLLITGQAQEAKYSYCLWGSFNSSSWTAIDMTEKDGKWVSAETTIISCNFGIKKQDASTGSQVEWWSSAGDAAVVLNTAMPLKVEGTNFSIDAGTYVFTLDPEAMTLTVTGEGGDDPNPPTPVEKDVYLVGELNGWTAGEEYKFAKEGNVYTLELADGLQGEWKINDGTWDWTFGGGAELDEGAAMPVESGVPAEVWFKSSQNLKSDLSGKVVIKFELVEGSAVNDSSIPSTITVTGFSSGVESVEVAGEAPVYFNLQGMKVANPENGIYVKVVNGKATKVIL